MVHEDLDNPEVLSSVEKEGCKGVTQSMGAYAVRLHASLSQVAFYQVPHSPWRNPLIAARDKQGS